MTSLQLTLLPTALQVFEEVSLCLLLLCGGDGWPVLPFPSGAPELSAPCAFLLHLWVFRWSLHHASPSGDGGRGGHGFLVIRPRGGVLPSRNTLPNQPTCCRSVLYVNRLPWLCMNLKYMALPAPSFPPQSLLGFLLH